MPHQIHPNPNINRPAKDRLLDAAFELFPRYGAAVTLKDIAERADTNLDTARKYFGDRDGLLGPYVASLISQVIKERQAATGGKPPPARGQLKETFAWSQQILRNWIAAFQQQSLKPDSAHCQLARLSAQLSVAADSVVQRQIFDFRRQEREWIKNACGAGGFRNHEDIADELILLIDGARNERQQLGHYGAARKFSRIANALLDAHRFEDECDDDL